MGHKPHHQSKSPSKNTLGQRGELLAKDLLLSKGYQFLNQNFRVKFGEIDLIFSNQKTLVFVEVKTRKYFGQGLPEEAVTPRKLHTIKRVAQYYMLKHDLTHQPARIDVVAVEFTRHPPVIRHLINVSQ